MTEANGHDTDIPTVSLAGKQWPIPELGVRQLRKVRRKIFEIHDLLKTAKVGGDIVKLFVELTDEQYDALCDVVYWSLTRAHKDMKREEFDDMAIGDGDLLRAFFVIRAQSGLFMPAAEGDGAGEAEAPENPGRTASPSLTGIESSPAP